MLITHEEAPSIRKAVSMGLKPYGSPTLSDQAVLDCPSFKMGPGDSARSHTADEYILLSELEQSLPCYLELLDGIGIAEYICSYLQLMTSLIVINCKNLIKCSQKYTTKK